jgi:pumilio RNA-binding family
VRRAIKDPYGNRVIENLIEVLPATQSSFVAKELLHVGAEFAQHRFGCRIVSRLAEHCCSSSHTVDLINEILEDVLHLSCDYWGHHAIDSILEHGLAEHKRWIVNALRFDVYRYANDTYGSYVINFALKFCSRSDCDCILNAFLANEYEMEKMATNDVGRHVVRQLRRVYPDIGWIFNR